MAVTNNSFRQHFPEFADREKYLDQVVEYWLSVAVKLLNADRWGDLIDTGTELWTAHNLAIEARALQDANAGGIPGAGSGLTASKSVDKVSISYDTSSVVEKDAGHWNLTTYGTRYYRLSRLVGAGPVQVGTGDYPSTAGPAWPGPML